MITEAFLVDYGDIIEDFTKFVCRFLNIDRPQIIFKEGTEYSQEHKTFGTYHPTSQEVIVVTEGRHIMDIFRTLAHELVHHRQIVQEQNMTLDEMEADANATAAIIMRKYASDCPDMFTILKEDVMVNSAGSGGVAGIGIGKDGEPGIKKSRKKFAGATVFEVGRDVFHRARFGKKHYGRYRDYVGEDGLGDEIRDYGNSNYGRPIILQDQSTGAMVYLRYGRK